MQTTRYILNEKRKRLEPTSTLCQYCYKAFTEEMSDNYFAPIYNEKDRTNIVVYRSVKFQKILIGIPRCKKCKAIHHNSAMYSWIIGFALAVGLVFLLNLFVDNIVYKIFFSILLFVPTLILTPSIFATILSARSGIFSEKEGAEREPQVMQMLREGWTLSHPTA